MLKPHQQQQRRGTVTFGVLAEATQRLLSDTFKSTPFGSSTPELKDNSCSITPSSTYHLNSPSISSRLSPSNSKIALGAGNRRSSTTNWYNIPLQYLDPSRESTLIAVQRQIKARDGILDSYRRVKQAFKQLQDGYVASKDYINLIHRYTDMKRMVRQVSAICFLYFNFSCMYFLGRFSGSCVVNVIQLFFNYLI